jgi:hypothetical protein
MRELHRDYCIKICNRMQTKINTENQKPGTRKGTGIGNTLRGTPPVEGISKSTMKIEGPGQKKGPLFK